MKIELITAFLLGLLAATAAIFAASFFGAYRRNRTKPMGWGLATLLCALFQVVICLPEVLGFVPSTLRLSTVNLLLDMTLVPVCSVMLLELAAVKKNPRWYPILHIVPFFVMVIVAICMPEEYSLYVMYTAFAITAVYATSILIYTLYAVWRYNKRLQQLYSDTENRDLTWLYATIFLIYGLEMFWCIVVPFNFLYALPVYYVLAIITWCHVAYFMLKHQDSSLIIEYDPEESSALTPDQREVIARTMPFVPELRQLEEEETFFLTPGLTIADLALRVGTNRSYLSEYLNKVCDRTFYDYINTIRVRHAARLLQGDAKMRQEDIMKASGFATMNTFRKAFIAEYGCSPADYRKQGSVEES